VTGPGLRHLATLPGLDELYLGESPVGDDGLALLGRIGSLRILSLVNTRATAAGLERLWGLSNLHELSIVGLPVSAADVEALHRALPDCEVVGGPLATSGSPRRR
jgi:hypothetical protein